MKKYILLLILILIFSISFIVGDAQNPKGNKHWANTWTEVEELGNNKFGATIHVVHQVFKDKIDDQYKKHKLTDERTDKDYVLIQSAKCCIEVYPYYGKYFDVDHEEVRLYEERWVIQRLFKAPDKWRDIDVYDPVISIEKTDNSIIVSIAYTTDYGPLIVKYIQRDGIALKHDILFINTSGSTETFKVLQKWAGIVGSKCNGKDIPMVEDTPYLAFHDSDKSQKEFNIAENLYSMMFNKDGSEKTGQCLQRPISIETHAQGMKADFIYGNWVLAQNESLEIDPGTATLDNPSDDGSAYVFAYNGSYGKHTDIFGNGSGAIGFYSDYDNIFRFYVEWDISSIPDGATITDVVFKYEGLCHEIDCHIHECKGIQPTTIGDGNDTEPWQSFYNELGEGTIYADPAGFPVIATNQQVDLGASVDSDLQSQLSIDWFAIGIQSDDEGSPAIGAIAFEEWPGVPPPTLYVEYEEAVPINVIFFSAPY